MGADGSLCHRVINKINTVHDAIAVRFPTPHFSVLPFMYCLPNKTCVVEDIAGGGPMVASPESLSKKLLEIQLGRQRKHGSQ